MRLSDALQGFWLERGIDLAKNTHSDYTTTYRRLSAFLGDPDFATIQADDLRRFLAHCQKTFGLGKKSIVNHWIALSSLWTWAEREHGCTHIIRGKIKRPRFQTREIEPLEASEITAMIDAAQWMKPYTTKNGHAARGRRATALRDVAILLTLLDSGLRSSELCDLCVKDFDRGRGRLHVRNGKGGKERYVPLGSKSQGAIGDYLASRSKAKAADPLFATRTNTHLDRVNLGNLLEGIGANAGVHNPHPHRWRHSFAIGFLRSGGNALLLQKLLGHSSLEMTMRYVKFTEQDTTGAGKFSPADRILTT